MAVEDAPSYAELQERLAQAERELAEARAEVSKSREREAEGVAREMATSEILRVIASSPTDLQAVLDTIAERAAKLCESDHAAIARVDDDA
jgi:hypothetical protein